MISLNHDFEMISFRLSYPIVRSHSLSLKKKRLFYCQTNLDCCGGKRFGEYIPVSVFAGIIGFG